MIIMGYPVQININDSISIITESGREIKAFASSVRDVRLRIMQTIDITKIELKQAFEDS